VPITVGWVMSDRDQPIAGLKTVTVTSAWTELGKTRSEWVMGYVRCSTVPCRVY
jgi:hypothetical protein